MSLPKGTKFAFKFICLYNPLISFSCLQNVVSTFHVIEKEREWRKSLGLPEGFDMLKNHKPLIAVGADAPLGGQQMQADYYRMSLPCSGT